MRLNRNFANVYTPFHEFEQLHQFQYDHQVRKEKRQKRRDLRMDMFFNRGDPLVNEPTSSDKKQQEHDAHGEFEVNLQENTYDAT
jgi:hypothetical protein